MTSSVAMGRAVDIVYPDFRKTSDTVCHIIFIDTQMKYRLDKWTMRWTENWLNQPDPEGCDQQHKGQLETSK